MCMMHLTLRSDIFDVIYLFPLFLLNSLYFPNRVHYDMNVIILSNELLFFVFKTSQTVMFILKMYIKYISF